MKEQVELVFEDVPHAGVNILAGFLLKRSITVEAWHSESGPIKPIDFEQALNLLVSLPTTGCVFVRVAQIKVGKILLKKSLLRFLRYDNMNDVEIVFERSDTDTRSWISFVKELADESKTLAKLAKANNYYCGYEPANDMRTRLFDMR